MSKQPAATPPVFVRLERERADLRLYRADGLHPDEPAGHRVYVSRAAVRDRLAAYGLADEAAALGVIMAEHWGRLHGHWEGTGWDKVWVPAEVPADLQVVLVPAEGGT